MDNAFDLGNERLLRAIERVEVLNLFFPWLGHSLILDARHTGDVPPAILLEPMVGSAEARLRSFAQLRPQLPLPDKLAVAPWLGSTRALVETGVYGAIVERWRALGYAEQERDLERALRQLRRLERAALSGLISGETSQAIWQRPE